MTTYLRKERVLAFLMRESTDQASRYREYMTQNLESHDPLERFAGSTRAAINHVAWESMATAVRSGIFDVRVEGGEEKDQAADVRRAAPKPGVNWETLGDDDDGPGDGKPLARRVMGANTHPDRGSRRALAKPAPLSWWRRLWVWLRLWGAR